jgi:hypothetical protein
MSATTDSPSARLPVSPSGVPRVRGARRAPGAGLDRVRLRLIACWRAGELDRLLAAGIDPQTTDVLALRAARITTRRNRARIADGLARALRSARDTTPGITAAMRPYGPELVEAGSVVAALDRCLRGPDSVNAQGVAILRTLLTEPASALYQPNERGALAKRLAAAAATLN